MRYEVIEMHLSDTYAVVPKALCGADTSHDLRDLKGYLEDRLHGASVGAVCQVCKALAMPLAGKVVEDMAKDLEHEGWVGDAEDCRELAGTLLRVTR